VSEQRRGFLGQLSGVVSSPRGAFAYIEGRDLMRGFSIIALIAALSAWAGMTYTSKIPLEALLPAGTMQMLEPQAIMQSIATFSALGGFIGAVMGWLISSLLVHAVASLASGGGSLRRWLAMTGFASTPLLGQQALRLIDAYTISPQALAEIVSAGRASTSLIVRAANLALTTFTVFGTLALILSIFAASTNYSVTGRRALAIVIAPRLALMALRLLLPV